MMMHQRLLFSLILVSASAVNSAQAGLIVVSEAVVETEVVTLADVADLSAVAEKASEQLKAFELFRGLKVGQEMTFTAAEVGRKLRGAMSQMKLSGDQRPLLKLPPELKVRRGAPFSESLFKNQIEEQVSTLCEPCRVQVQEIKVPQKLATSQCALWNWDKDAIRLKANMLIPVEVRCDDHQAYNLPVQIRFFKEGYVASEPLPSGQFVSAAAVKSDWIDVTHATSSLIETSQMAERKLKRRLRPGQGLFVQDFDKKYDVERGHVAKVIVLMGALEVASEAIVQRDGMKGERVTMKSMATGQLLSGRVIDSGLVRVE